MPKEKNFAVINRITSPQQQTYKYFVQSRDGVGNIANSDLVLSEQFKDDNKGSFSATNLKLSAEDVELGKYFTVEFTASPLEDISPGLVYRYEIAYANCSDPTKQSGIFAAIVPKANQTYKQDVKFSSGTPFGKNCVAVNTKVSYDYPTPPGFITYVSKASSPITLK